MLADGRPNQFASAAWAALVAAPALGALDDGPGAARRGPFAWGIAAESVYFDYREFDRNGDELNHESGALPGLRLWGWGERGAVLSHFEVGLHGGSVDYDGETQSGRPVQTTTETGLLAFDADIGRWADPARRAWIGFFHLGRRLWARDIQSGDGAQGLYEEYRWSEVGVGLRRVGSPAAAGGWRHQASANVFAVVDGSIFVELSGIEGRDWDDTTLELGRAMGLRLQYAAHRPLAAGRELRLGLYYAYWGFGRSNTERVTSDGAATGFTVTEPRSESQRLGVNVGLAF
jgi:hypothetical protein